VCAVTKILKTAGRRQTSRLMQSSALERTS
jgi:hypothetical protein